jgi:hypothetical protein
MNTYLFDYSAGFGTWTMIVQADSLPEAVDVFSANARADSVSAESRVKMIHCLGQCDIVKATK